MEKTPERKIKREPEIDKGIRKIVRYLNELPFLKTVASCEGHPTYIGHGSYDGDCYVFLTVNDEKAFFAFLKEISSEYEGTTRMVLTASKQFYFAMKGVNDYHWRLGFWTTKESWDEVNTKLQEGRRCLERLLLRYIIKHEREWK